MSTDRIYSVGDQVTHVTYRGHGVITHSDDIKVKVRWEVDAPPHVTEHYHAELRSEASRVKIV